MTATAADAGRIASIRQRLLEGARARGEELQYVLDRFAVERFLYRLSISPHREQFLLKGAMLFALWFEQPHRPTRDADFLGFGSPDPERLAAIARELCTIQSNDGLNFDPASIVVAPIREQTNYGGFRLSLRAKLGRSLCSVQWDVGFGDAVTPAAIETDFPVLLKEFPAPHLRVYPRETVFAEKLEAIASLGIANSRMKDYFDLRALIHEDAVNRVTLAAAIQATFERRGTPPLRDTPLGLTDAFSADAQKQALWNAFLRRNRLPSLALHVVVGEIRTFVHSVCLKAPS